MNAIFYRPTGQLPTEVVLTFSECMDIKDYLSAYRCISPPQDKDEELFGLIETLVESDLYEEILEIFYQIEIEPEQLSFLFNAATEYLKKGNLTRVYDMYGLLDVNYRFSLVTRMLVNEPNDEKKLAIIDDILCLHKVNNDIPGAICLVIRLTFGDHESILFNLGLELIQLKKWRDCSFISQVLQDRKNEFQALITQAQRNEVRLSA